MKKYENPEIEKMEVSSEIITESPSESAGTQTTQMGQTGVWDLNHGA